MDRLDSKITFFDSSGTIPAQVFDFCTEVKIESSYDNLTDTAEFVIPKKLRYITEDGAPVDSIVRGNNPLFIIGDKAKIEVGYNGALGVCFVGFIAGIRQKFPLRFNLEDEIYQLKKKSITLSLQNPKLSELIAKIIPEGVKYEVTAEQNLGNFRITNATAAEVLDELRTKHGVYSFFRDGTLYVGLSINKKLQKVHRFQFQTPQLIDGEKLNYVDAKERKIKVVCKSIDNKNTALEATAGDASGEVRTMYFNNYTLKDLQSTADRLVKEYRYSGYDGEFTIFATPLVNHGDVVELINLEIPEQSGGYLVTKVVTRFGWDIGGRQDVTIKQKIYDLYDSGNGKFIQKPITS